MLVALMPVGAYAALTPGGVENVSDLININIPDVNNVIDPSYLQPMEAGGGGGGEGTGGGGAPRRPAGGGARHPPSQRGDVEPAPSPRLHRL